MDFKKPSHLWTEIQVKPKTFRFAFLSFIVWLRRFLCDAYFTFYVLYLCAKSYLINKNVVAILQRIVLASFTVDVSLHVVCCVLTSNLKSACSFKSDQVKEISHWSISPTRAWQVWSGLAFKECALNKILNVIKLFLFFVNLLLWCVFCHRQVRLQ